MNSTSVKDSFEKFVKEDMSDYSVEDFTMDVKLQCDRGQVLSEDHQTCGKIFSSLPNNKML